MCTCGLSASGKTFCSAARTRARCLSTFLRRGSSSRPACAPGCGWDNACISGWLDVPGSAPPVGELTRRGDRLVFFLAGVFGGGGGGAGTSVSLGDSSAVVVVSPSSFSCVDISSAPNSPLLKQYKSLRGDHGDAGAAARYASSINDTRSESRPHVSSCGCTAVHGTASAINQSTYLCTIIIHALKREPRTAVKTATNEGGITIHGLSTTRRYTHAHKYTYITRISTAENYMQTTLSRVNECTDSLHVQPY